MTDSVKQRYDVYLNTPHTGLVKVAEAVLLESAGQLTATLAPRPASSRAMALPRPLVPPVTSANFPWRFIGIPPRNRWIEKKGHLV